eukprot:2282028-Amphidinium_carterae.4
MSGNIKAAFADEEAALHSRMHPSVARGRCGHADVKLVDDLFNGFNLVGALGNSGVLVPCLGSAEITVEELVGHSTWVNKVSAAMAAGQPLEATVSSVSEGPDATSGRLWQEPRQCQRDDEGETKPDGVEAIAGNIVAMHRAANEGLQ